MKSITIQLPDPIDTEELEDGVFYTMFPESVGATHPDGRVFDEDADIDPAYARRLAASLLAAADAAEGK